MPKRRDFHVLWAATGTANLGDALYQLALPLIAWQVTHSAGQVAGVTVLLTLAWPLFGLHAGLLVDLTDRRRLIIAVNLIRMVALAALTGVLIAGAPWIGWIYLVAFVLGAGEALVDTALAALVPQTVPDREDLPRANARIEVAQNVTNQFVGPPLGGLLAGAGLAWVTGIGTLLYAATAPVLALMRGDYRATTEPVERRRGDLTAGIRFIWASPLLRGLTLLTAAMNLFFAAWVSVLVVYVVTPGPVGLSPARYGLLLTTMAVGSIVGAAAVTRLRRRFGAYRLLALDVIGTILLVGTPALTTNPFLIGGAMFVGGAGSAVWRVIVAVIRQAVTPADRLGRVYAASRVISWGVLPLGAAIGGLVAELAGVRTVFVVVGLASIGLLAAYTLTIRPAQLAAALER